MNLHPQHPKRLGCSATPAQNGKSQYKSLLEPSAVRELLRQAVTQTTSGLHLTRSEMRQVVDILVACDLAEEPYGILAGALLCSLKTKGETVDEIVGAADSLRHHQIPIEPPSPGEIIVDTCGTGGDGAHLINISTITGIVLATIGLTVAKHGNRSVSSACGSADLLEHLGYPLHSSPTSVSRCMKESSFGFLFAPHFHPALKNLAALRRSLGVRTIFNMLGPLVNPINVSHQMIGVFDRSIVEPMARAAAELGLQRVMVVHGEGGLDELSPFGRSWVAVCDGNGYQEMEWTPSDFGADPVALEELAGGGPQENAQKCRELFAGKRPEAARAVAMNCAALLWLVGRADSLSDGYKCAFEALASGRVEHAFSQMRNAARGQDS